MIFIALIIVTMLFHFVKSPACMWYLKLNIKFEDGDHIINRKDNIYWLEQNSSNYYLGAANRTH